MKNSCTGVCLGFLLFFGSIGLLIYNEGRTVKRAKDIDEGMEVVVNLNLTDYQNASSIPTEFENQLIHAVGDLSTVEALVDPTFGVGGDNNSTTSSSSNSLKLLRSVEMYQWVESSSSRKVKTAGGGTRTETTYSYNTRWSSQLINSNSFHDTSPVYKNPTSFPFPTLLLTADPILLGNIVLSDAVVGRINWFQDVSRVSLSDVPDATLRSQLDLYGQSGFFYKNDFTYVSSSSSNSNPAVGNTRITFDEVQPDTISIVALFRSDSLNSYTTSRGGLLLLVKRGVFTSEELFQQADDENTTLAWILRFVGFFLMVVSIVLVLQPLATAVDIIPFVGDCMQGGMERCIFPTIAVLIALPISLVTISLAWLAYRPIWSIPILIVGAALVVWLCFRVRKAKQDAEEMGEGKPDNDATAPPAETATGPYQLPYQHQPITSTVTSGFSSAPDNLPPSAPVEAIPIVEPDVVIGEPYKPSAPYKPSEPEVDFNKPFVPQVYKP